MKYEVTFTTLKNEVTTFYVENDRQLWSILKKYDKKPVLISWEMLETKRMVKK